MRYYSSNAQETVLTSGVSTSSTTFIVDNPIGYPSSVPFEIQIDSDTESEEICLVTAVAGNTWSVDRGFDGSTPFAHLAGAKVYHGVSGIDFQEPQNHLSSAANVHGLPSGSDLVGTVGAQTLANKTLTSPIVSGPVVSGSTHAGGTFNLPAIGNLTNAQHNHTSVAQGGPAAGGIIFPKSYRSATQLTQSDSFTDIADTTITFTAPAVWPSSASGIAWNLAINCFKSSTTPDAYFRVIVDGNTNPIMPDFLATVAVTYQQLNISTFTALPTAGASHTAKWQWRLSQSSYTLQSAELFCWAYVI